MSGIILFAYTTKKQRTGTPVINPPPGFTAPAYIWRPARDGEPGHNAFVCCVSERKPKPSRDCCCGLFG